MVEVAGRLRHRLTIEQMVPSRDAAGGVVNAPTLYAHVWGDLQAITGREYFAAGATQAETDHRLTIRYLEGVDSTMRITLGSRTFDVLSVRDVDGRKTLLELMLRERL